MANKQVNELPAITAVVGNDLLHIKAAGGVDNKLEVKDFVKSQGIVRNYDTLALMQANISNLQIGQVCSITERTTGNGGGANWKVVAKTTENGFNIVTGDATRSLQLIINASINIRALGALADDATDIKSIVDAANALLTNGGEIFIPTGSYYLSGDGATLTRSNLTIRGEEGTFIRCERTYYLADTPTAGKHVVGQGNIFNGANLTNIKLKDITFVGAYDTAWNNQNMANGTVPYQSNSKLLFLDSCTNVTLDNFSIKKAFSSNSSLGASGYDSDIAEKYGWNQILLTGCNKVRLTNCKHYSSCGEAWHIYNCDDVIVSDCSFDNDYGVSFLDITYCSNVTVTGSNFLKRLISDAGELLNVASSNATVSGNNFLNGNLDIGNEYINRQASLTLANTFVIRNISATNNTLVNGHIAFSTKTNTPSGISDWVQENAVVSNNTIIVDLDTRPAADGSTVLNYTGVQLPLAHDYRNFSINDNVVLLKGALQTVGANPHLYNRIRLINGLNEGSGMTVKGLTIRNNRFQTDLSNYDPTKINDDSGVVLLGKATWQDVIIEGNVFDCECGIKINAFDDITNMRISNNDATSETFLNIPWKASAAFTVDNLEVSNNRFTFINTSGYTYTSANVSDKGFGCFVNMYIGATSTVTNMTVKNNKVQSPSFVLATNFNTTTQSLLDITMTNNIVEFVDFAAGAPTYYPIYTGRTTGSQTPNGITRFIDNYFTESSISTVNFFAREVMAFEMHSNVFIGTFDIDVQADASVAGVPESRLILMNNVSTVAFDIAVLNLDGSAVTINSTGNVNITYS